MKRFIPLLSLILVLVTNPLAAQEALSLEDAINYALENNLELKNAQLNVVDANEQIVERRAIGIPQINAGVNYQYFIDIPTQVLPDFLSPSIYGVLFAEGLVEPRELMEGPGVPAQFGTKHNLTASVDLSTLIFDGSYFVGLQAAKAYRTYSQQQLVSSQNDIKNRVKEAYMPALIIQESVVTLNKNIEKIESLLFETKALYKEGFVEQLDVDRLELSLANLETDRDNLQRQEEVAVNALKFIIGYPMDQTVQLSDNINTLSVDVKDEALTSPVNFTARPEYTVAQLGLQLNELNVRLNKAGYLPSLAGFGTFQYSLLADELSEGEWFPTTVVGLQLNVPIFDGLNKKAKVQRAKIGMENARNQLIQLERAIELELSNARISYVNARRKLEDQERNLGLAERIYNTTQIKYKEGVGSSLEITQAEQSLYQSQQNYNQALYDLLIAKIGLEKALGL